MSIKELYEWAIKNDVENFELRAQYADDGGFYTGDRAIDYDIEINQANKEVIV